MKDSFSDLNLNELIQKKEELSAELRGIRFDMVMGHIENPVNKRNLRRKVARLNTLIHEHEKGIRKA